MGSDLSVSGASCCSMQAAPHFWLLRGFNAIPLAVVALRLGPFLTSYELSILCALQRTIWNEVALMARCVAASQHGIVAEGITKVRHLAMLESVRRSCHFDFSSPDFLKDSHVQLVRGSSLAYPIFVGNEPTAVTTAVNPPASGDAWAITVDLQRGWYRVKVAVWRNPFHGILDLWFDDSLISGLNGLDCYSAEFVESHTFPTIEIEIKSTGVHVWRFETRHSNENPHRQWMCLQNFSAELTEFGRHGRRSLASI